MKSHFEFDPFTLPPAQQRDMKLMRDSRPIVNYGENAVDRQQPTFEPAPSPAWQQPLKKAPRE